jgi:[ribosomal protein S18]-alanine N-acetyltransferase
VRSAQTETDAKNESRHENRSMSIFLRPYEPRDFATLYRIDQSCYPRGIAYSKITLRWFLGLAGAECLVAETDGKICGFILAEEHPPLGHIITIDVVEAERRGGVGSALLQAIEANLQRRAVRIIVLEAATNNEPAVAFWQKHGYRVEGVLKRYYLGRLDAYEMKKVLPPPKEI